MVMPLRGLRCLVVEAFVRHGVDMNISLTPFKGGRAKRRGIIYMVHVVETQFYSNNLLTLGIARINSALLSLTRKVIASLRGMVFCHSERQR